MRDATHRIFIALLLGSIAGLGASAAVPRDGAPYWHLVFSYDAKSLSLVRAQQIPPGPKQPRTPGLRGSRVRAQYELAWLDAAGKTLLSGEVELPLEIRAFSGDGAACQTVVPETGLIVVRVPGPEATRRPAAIRLTRRNVIQRQANPQSLVIPKAFQSPEYVLPLPKAALPARFAPGPISSAKIRDTGDDRNRLVIVVLGDGYTSADLASGQFTSDTLNLVAAFQAKSPWNIYLAETNIYRVDVESAERGADEPPNRIFVDTYFNASFWTSGIERLLTIDIAGMLLAMDAADQFVGPEWDFLFILVNSQKYGGAGGSISVSSINPASSEVIPHEMGHSFAGLADEYEYGSTSPPIADTEPNVDFDCSGTALKWLPWVEPGTPLPTPENTSYSAVVGAFEGAKYFLRGIYRPWYMCLMRANGRPFCPVCREAHVVAFAAAIDFADLIEPPTDDSVHVGGGPTRFAIVPAPLTPLTFEWKLWGTAVAGATSASLSLRGSDLPAESNTLELVVRHATPLVRLTDIYRTYRWTVLRTPATLRARSWALYR